MWGHAQARAGHGGAGFHAPVCLRDLPLPCLEMPQDLGSRPSFSTQGPPACPVARLGTDEASLWVHWGCYLPFPNKYSRGT